MLTQAEFRKQISASGKTTLGAIETDGETPRALFFAAFLVDLGAGQPELIAAAKRYAMWHALQEPSAARSRLVSDGCLAFLTSTWNDLGQAHYDGPELVTFAEWILALTTTAGGIGELPSGFVNLVLAQTSRALDVLGAPGCQSLVGTVVISLGFNGPFAQSVPFAVPNVPAFVGGSLFSQALAIAPGVNAFGLVASNGLELELGNR